MPFTPPSVTNCHTFSDPLPLERDVLYGRPPIKRHLPSHHHHHHHHHHRRRRSCRRRRQRCRMNCVFLVSTRFHRLATNNIILSARLPHFSFSQPLRLRLVRY